MMINYISLCCRSNKSYQRYQRVEAGLFYQMGVCVVKGHQNGRFYPKAELVDQNQSELLYIIKMMQVHLSKNVGQRVLPSQQGLGEVWISGYKFAQNTAQLKKHNISAICSAVGTSFMYPPEIKHKIFYLMDNETQEIKQYLKPACEFIQSQRKRTNVLIHCAAGISRSATLLTAYIMQMYGKSPSESLKIVQTARPICRPNTGFMKQLKEYEKQIHHNKPI